MSEIEEKSKRELAAMCRTLKAENDGLKRQINAYVKEFRVCRFCANVHADCSPTDTPSCYPKWRGL